MKQVVLFPQPPGAPNRLPSLVLGKRGPYKTGRSEPSSRELLHQHPQEGRMLGGGQRVEALPIPVTLVPMIGALRGRPLLELAESICHG